MQRSHRTPSEQCQLTAPDELATEHPASSPTGDAGQSLATAISRNAVFSAASGLVLLGGGFALDAWLGVDAWLLVGVGGGLVVFAGLLLWLLSRPRRLRAGARLVVAADAAWVAGAALLLARFPSALSSAGKTALAVVSAVVAVLAVLQVIGLRRAGSGPVTGEAPVTTPVSRPGSQRPRSCPAMVTAWCASAPTAVAGNGPSAARCGTRARAIG